MAIIKRKEGVALGVVGKMPGVTLTAQARPEL